VVPCYNEEASIAAVVRDFKAQEHVDRVFVADNNSRDGSAARAAEAGAEIVPAPRQGYGEALRAGLDHAVAQGLDVVVLTEADGSFRASDLPKLLAYLPDCAMVREPPTWHARGHVPRPRRRGRRALLQRGGLDRGGRARLQVAGARRPRLRRGQQLP
ncbi:MAG TPA: glycosyltransferase, partial [Planctomycetota bacterium]|nr:glycosyltransferase [Planctomycetota bacterium]